MFFSALLIFKCVYTFYRYLSWLSLVMKTLVRFKKFTVFWLENSHNWSAILWCLITWYYVKGSHNGGHMSWICYPSCLAEVMSCFMGWLSFRRVSAYALQLSAFCLTYEFWMSHWHNPYLFVIKYHKRIVTNCYMLRKF